jgi:tetratricopeptide (TPR) repeat protein
MTMYAVARLEEIEELTDGREPYRPVRHHFGITSFGINAWTAPEVGDRIINEHDESEPDSDEELYLVLRGVRRSSSTATGSLRLGDARLCAARREADGVRRGARDDGHRARRHPGKAVRAKRLGDLGPRDPLYEAGEYAEAADRGRELVEAHPQYPGLLYNLACCESLAGRTGDAVDHLGRAIDRSGPVAVVCSEDSDFDPIRDEPRSSS